VDPQRRTAWTALWIAAPAPSLGAAAAFYLAPGAAGNALYALGKAILYGLPLLWLWRVDRAPLSLSPAKRGGLGVGAGIGLLVGGGIVAAYALFFRETIDGQALRDIGERVGFATRGRYLLAAAYLILVNALLEEYAFRWFLYTRCRRVFPSGVALVVAALLFTAHHVLVLRAFFDWPFVLLGSGGVFAGGLLFTWCYKRYRSVWPGYLCHALADVGVLAVGWDLLFGA
jgi:membrane protease YdiL (CAAX protease family)